MNKYQMIKVIFICLCMIILSNCFIFKLSKNIIDQNKTVQELQYQDINTNINNLKQQADSIYPLKELTTEHKYNVLAYGADKTGTYDSTEAVNSAIADAQTAGGGTIYFPSGYYKCGNIDITSSRIAIIGENTANTIIKPIDNSDYLFKFHNKNKSDLIYDVSLAQLELDISNTDTNALYLQSIGQSRFFNIMIRGYNSNSNGIVLDKVYQTFFYDIEEQGCFNGVDIQYCNDAYFIGGRFDANSNCGIRVSECGGLYLNTITMYGNKNCALVIQGDETHQPKDIFLSDIICDTSKEINLYLDNVLRLQASNCWFATTEYNHGIYMIQSNTITFDNCLIGNNAKCGIYASSNKNIKINNCTFWQNNLNSDIKNYGLYLGYSEHCIINENLFLKGNTQNQGIKIDQSNKYIITNNDLSEMIIGIDSNNINKNIISDNLLN